MNNKSAVMNRRTFLRGSGLALALPWFESMAVGGPAVNETPKRFVSVYHPDGVGGLELVSSGRRKRLSIDQSAGRP
jgi:hypothetical protein